MNITKFLNKVYFAPRLKEIEQYTSHAGELQQLVHATSRPDSGKHGVGKESTTMPLSVLMKISRSAFPYKLTKK